MTKGDKELKCNDGAWVGMVPTCIKVNCGYPGQIANGKILYIGSIYITFVEIRISTD
jgi:hypothetical protein